MISAEIPKGVSIIVKNGEYLEYCLPGSKKTAKSRRWCVVFIGGKKKMITDLVDAQDGCPVWDSEVSIELVSPADPVVMLVLDGDRRHIGQVVVPLAQIPRTGPPNFDPSRLQYSELQPTKKNSSPRGRISYWIWATSYWPPGTKIDIKSKSIRRSLSHLGRHKSKITLSRSQTVDFWHQPHGASSIGGFDDQHSTFSSDARSSRAPSMVSGAYSESNLSIGTSYFGGAGGHIQPTGGMWGNTTGQSGYGSTLDVSGSSYNPLANCDESASVSGRPPSYLPGIGSVQRPSEAGSMMTLDTPARKHKSILKKMRQSLSQSTHKLTASAAKKAGSEKVYGRPHGSVISINSIKDRPILPDSTSAAFGRFSNGSMGSIPNDNYSTDHTMRASVNDGGNQLPPSNTLSPFPPRQGELGSDSPMGFPTKPADSPLSVHDTIWGLHAEERPKKPFEEMSHREIVTYAIQLERSSQVTRSELARVQGERDELMKKVEESDKETDSVRSALADLRFRLLTAGLTEFLELPSDSNKTSSVQPLHTGSVWDDRKRSFSVSGFRSSNTTNGEPQPSFFEKLTALTQNTRKFGALGNSNDVQQPPPQAPTTVTDWW